VLCDVRLLMCGGEVDCAIPPVGSGGKVGRPIRPVGRVRLS